MIPIDSPATIDTGESDLAYHPRPDPERHDGGEHVGDEAEEPHLQVPQGEDQKERDEQEAEAGPEHHRRDVAAGDLTKHHGHAGRSRTPHARRAVLRQPRLSQTVLLLDHRHAAVAVPEGDVDAERALVDVDLIVDVEPVGQRELVQQQVLGGQLSIVGQPVLRGVVPRGGSCSTASSSA